MTKRTVAHSVRRQLLFPSTADNDRQLKRRIYERAGVTEYWIVDPAERRVTQLVLQDWCYAEARHGDELCLAVLTRVAIPLAEIW